MTDTINPGLPADPSHHIQAYELCDCAKCKLARANREIERLRAEIAATDAECDRHAGISEEMALAANEWKARAEKAEAECKRLQSIIDNNYIETAF